jgi:energy-coupling factor transport system permease protein
MQGATDLTGTGETRALDPRTRLLLLFGVCVTAVFLESATGLLALAGLTLLAFVWARPSPRLCLVFAIAFLVVCWGTVTSQGLFYPGAKRQILLTLVPADLPVLGQLTGGVFLYEEGLWHGLLQTARLSATLAAGLTLCATTRPEENVSGLIALGLPYPLALMILAAIRFLPTLGKELQAILQSLRLRGLRLRGPISVAAALPLVLLPVLVACVRRSQAVALAMELRGIEIAKAEKPTKAARPTPSLRLQLRDRAVLVVAGAAVSLVVALKIVHLLVGARIISGEVATSLDWFSRQWL